MRIFAGLFLSLSFLSLTACDVAAPESLSGQSQRAVEHSDDDAAAILALVNHEESSESFLDIEVGLDARAARHITLRKASQGLFETLAELDAVPYVGTRALNKLLAHSALQVVSAADVALLALVNDMTLSESFYDEDVGLNSRAAHSIVSLRPFETRADLDDAPYIGPAALEKLQVFADATAFEVESVFSPQLYPLSHSAKSRRLIEGAEYSLDIAMYSFRDHGLLDAVLDARARGVVVRVLLESANKDRRRPLQDRRGTFAGKLEAAGADVRYVNKIMHHKFVIADGPRDDLEKARSAKIASGSANWSHSAATRYDENTLFLQGNEGVSLATQKEFEHLWRYSRDFLLEEPLPFVLGRAQFSDLSDDNADARVYFTSDNFIIRGTNTFSVVRERNSVADRFVEAIENAEDSIYIASGHMRSRPIAEALMAKKASMPEIDIRLYLDGQEMISHFSHAAQEEELEHCLSDAVSAREIHDCEARGFLFGYALSQAGIDVRYKHYSYRWHYSYAVQMHHKYMIVDERELLTGSYNFSDNAEHNTFENVMHFSGNPHASTVAEYLGNFHALRETSRDDGSYEALMHQVENDAFIPLVYTPMALTHDEVSVLKDAIRENCAAINSEDFRRSPERHRRCERL